MEQLIVTVTSFSNAGKQSVHKETCGDMVDVSRFLLTFKPKRGYDPVTYRIEKEIVLI